MKISVVKAVPPPPQPSQSPPDPLQLCTRTLSKCAHIHGIVSAPTNAVKIAEENDFAYLMKQLTSIHAHLQKSDASQQPLAPPAASAVIADMSVIENALCSMDLLATASATPTGKKMSKRKSLIFTFNIKHRVNRSRCRKMIREACERARLCAARLDMRRYLSPGDEMEEGQSGDADEVNTDNNGDGGGSVDVPEEKPLWMLQQQRAGGKTERSGSVSRLSRRFTFIKGLRQSSMHGISNNGSKPFSLSVTNSNVKFPRNSTWQGRERLESVKIPLEVVKMRVASNAADGDDDVVSDSVVVQEEVAQDVKDVKFKGGGSEIVNTSVLNIEKLERCTVGPAAVAQKRRKKRSSTQPNLGSEATKQAMEQGSGSSSTASPPPPQEEERPKERNMWRAASMYKLAADKGDARSMCDLATCFQTGLGVERDPAHAVKLLTEAAEQGLPRAQFSLARCYAFGEGVGRDVVKGVQLYEQAAGNGHSAAMCNLGVCYQKGVGVADKDVHKAVQLYKQSGQRGYARAWYNLGVCYESGVGVGVDVGKAVALYKRAARGGFASAMCTLGACYESGTGVDTDLERAAVWYKRAARGGCVRANFFLGLCYERGCGVGERDVDEAVRLFKKAAQAGSQDAAVYLKAMKL